MKKIIALFVVALLLCGTMSACSNNSKTTFHLFSFSLEDKPVANEEILTLEGASNAFRVEFDVPETGYIKLLAYDSTDYENWPEVMPRIYADIKDAGGKVIYDNIEIGEGTFEKYLIEKGKATAEITFEFVPAGVRSIALSWAFATESDGILPLAIDGSVAALADENGQATFSFTAEKQGIYSFTPTEACTYEWDGSFRVENADGEDVAGELSIHGTEWISRSVFLPEGEYTVTVSELSAVACCSVKLASNCEEAVLENKEGQTVPVQFGFTLPTSGERVAKLTADGSSKSLMVVSGGSDTYYDSVHTANVKITDAEGNVIAEEICEEFLKIDISEYSGEYTVTVSASGSCVVELILMDE